MRRNLLTTSLALCYTQLFFSQEDTAKAGFFSRVPASDSLQVTNQDAIYARPFIALGRSGTAIGGYLEGNTNYFAEDGVSEGFSMEMRRFNIFMYASLHQRIKFLSELEFEHGTEEIALETALIDFMANPALNLRAGVILPQIGMVNANHDSPKWDFVERPLTSTQLIPTTLSEIGFGVHGKFFPGNAVLTYDAYIVNGLQDDVVLNEEGKTFIPAGKNTSLLGEDNNGEPMYNGKIALAFLQKLEVGISWYGGAYNSYKAEGEVTDNRRMLSIAALDFSATAFRRLQLTGEFVIADIQVPHSLSEIYGDKQSGGFLEASLPLAKGKMLGFENAEIRSGVRMEAIDFNIGDFSATGTKRGDEVHALSGSLSFRPSAGTVIRFNYRHHRIYDFLGNPPALFGGFQFGLATYF